MSELCTHLDQVKLRVPPWKRRTERDRRQRITEVVDQVGQ
jgi:hypothetical protein